MSTGQIIKTEPRTNTARSPPRPTRRHRREAGTGKSATGKQAGNGTRHAIITTARTSTDPDGGGLIEARKQERAGGSRAKGTKKSIASLRSRSNIDDNEMNSKQERQSNQSATAVSVLPREKGE